LQKETRLLCQESVKKDSCSFDASLTSLPLFFLFFLWLVSYNLNCHKGEPDGYCRINNYSAFCPHLLGAVGALPEPDGVKMTLFYWLAGLITLALLIYLIFGLLKPEWFE
jgi:K+-transporting ATPase KdpF subunit